MDVINMSFEKPRDTISDEEVCEYLNMSTSYGIVDLARHIWEEGYRWGWAVGYEDGERDTKTIKQVDKKRAEETVNDLVALTILTNMIYRTVDDMYEFCEICDDHGFDITGDIDFYGLYNEEQEKLFEEWHIKANDLFLKTRFKLLSML